MLEVAERVAMEASNTRRRWYVATFRNEVEDLVDMEEVSEESRNEPQWLHGFKGSGGTQNNEYKL